jgi:hypothetical protein
MIPVKSNTAEQGCSPVSSNCVLWQGPDLPCINLCNGDSVSDVVYKLAVELCKLKEQTGLSDLDLTCLLDICQTTPQPDLTLSAVLELLINKVCCLADVVENLPSVGPQYVEPDIPLLCLSFTNPLNQSVTQLPLSQATQLIAAKLCELRAQFQAHQTLVAGQIQNLQNQIDNLPGSPQISAACVTPSTDLEVVVETLATQFCEYKSSLGPASEITVVKSRQCQNLNNAVPLASGTGTMSGLAGWKNNPQNLAESLQNMWLTICDIRGAVKLIQDNCCKVSCDDILIDFDAKMDGPTLRLFFGVKSVLPSGFTDCDSTLGNKLNLQDGNGQKWYTYVKLRQDIFDDPNVLQMGYEIDLQNTPLDASTGITFTMDACFTDGATSCIKCVSVYMAPGQSGCCTLTASDDVTIVYQICNIASTSTTTTNS